MGLGAFRWRVPCREQINGATARRESSSTSAPARRASGLSRSSGYLNHPGYYGVPGSCGLFIFSASAHVAPRRNDTITEGPQLEGRPALSARDQYLPLRGGRTADLALHHTRAGAALRLSSIIRLEGTMRVIFPLPPLLAGAALGGLFAPFAVGSVPTDSIGIAAATER